MMNVRIYFFVIGIIVACSDKDNTPVPLQPVLYIVGYDAGKPVYWKDEIKTTVTDIPALSSVLVNSGFVSGTDVYIVGTVDDRSAYPPYGNGPVTFRPYYWKNGIAVSLPSSNIKSEAYAIYVSGTDVYVTGYDATPNGNLPVLWKNGVKSVLPTTGANSGAANSVSVSRNDIHIIGYDGANTIAHWKNGALANSFPAPFYHEPTILAAGSDVYIAARDAALGFYSTNGVKTTLQAETGSLNNSPNGIVLSGSDVYVTGFQYFDPAVSSKYGTTFWKNGVPTSIDIKMFSKSIFVFGNDVYLAGLSFGATGVENVPAYWKNGVLTTLGTVGAAVYITMH